MKLKVPIFSPLPMLQSIKISNMKFQFKYEITFSNLNFKLDEIEITNLLPAADVAINALQDQIKALTIPGLQKGIFSTSYSAGKWKSI